MKYYCTTCATDQVPTHESVYNYFIKNPNAIGMRACCICGLMRATSLMFTEKRQPKMRLVCLYCKKYVPGLAHARPVKTSNRRCDECGVTYRGTMYGVLRMYRRKSPRSNRASIGRSAKDAKSPFNPKMEYFVLVLESDPRDRNNTVTERLHGLSNAVLDVYEETMGVHKVGVVRPEMLGTTMGWLDAALHDPDACTKKTTSNPDDPVNDEDDE